MFVLFGLTDRPHDLLFRFEARHSMNRILFSLPACGLLLSAALPAWSASPSVAPTSAQTQTLVVSPFERVENLPNGLRLVSKIDRTAPRIALSLQVRVGASDESAQNAGWRRLYAGAVSRGVPVAFAGKVPTEDGLGLSRLAEDAGGDAGIRVGDDVVEFWAVGDSERAPQLLQLLVALWQSPRLGDEDISWARTRLSEQLDAQDLDLAAQTNTALRSQEFVNERGEPISYGLSEVGTTQSLQYLSAERVRELGQRVAHSPATLSAVGDVDLAALRARLSQLPTPSATPSSPPRFRTLKVGKPALVVRELPIQAAWVFISYPLGHVKAEDAPMLRLLSAALSDIPDARLPARLLGTSLVQSTPQALSLSSQFVQRRDGSELLISAQTAPSRVENVKNVILDEVRRLRETPLTAQQFALARDFSRGDWALSRQSLRDRAFLVGQTPITTGAPDGSWPLLLNQATPKKAQSVARRSLNSYAVALVMPGSE